MLRNVKYVTNHHAVVSTSTVLHHTLLNVENCVKLHVRKNNSLDVVQSMLLVDIVLSLCFMH